MSNPNNESQVDAICRNCGAKFKATIKGTSIVCKGLRQHIIRRSECFDSYNDEKLVLRGRVIDLSSSIQSHSKRKMSDEVAKPPHPKRILVQELNISFLEDNFGFLPSSNTLPKGQKFADKSIMIRSRSLLLPDTQKMNDFLCHGGTFFNHFTDKAILLNPKIENLVSKEKLIVPPTEIALFDDASSAVSLIPVEGVLRQPDSIVFPEQHFQDLDDDSSESDDDLDGGSLRGPNDDDSDESTQRMGSFENAHQPNGQQNQPLVAPNVAGDSLSTPGEPPTVAENAAHAPAFEPPNLLGRWLEQRDRNTIIPGIPPDPFVVSKLGLLHLQHKHGFSLQAVQDIKKWAFRSCQDYPRIFDARPLSRKQQLKKIRLAMGIKDVDSFQEVAIDWLPQNKKRGIQVRSIYDAFYELLTNEELAGEDGSNYAFPSATNPYAIYPDEEPEDATELYHGWWYAETAKEICTGPRDILGVIIAYMDGVQTDKNDRLPVTPLNITLGLFNTETRRKPEAWTTILLYPDDDSEASTQKGTKSFHKVQNLHNCIRVAFSELKELMDGNHGIPWQIRYAGKTWDVVIKFAFGYVIGDTEMHDKLCGRYGSRTSGIKSICRHCTIPTDCLAEGGSIFEDQLFYCPESLDPDTHSEEYFKSISHHPIRNAFHELYFGANKFNIHLATPGELLHMLQKGACVRALEGFVSMWSDPTIEQDSITAVDNNHRCQILLDEMDLLGKMYGGYLFRQSDRNKPRTKFRSSLFTKTKKSGHEHGGQLMDVLCALISNRGRQILAERKVDERWVENYVYLFELLLQFEQFMKMKSIPIITKGSRQKGESIEKMSDSEEGESLTSASSHDSPAGGSNASSQDKAQRKALSRQNDEQRAISENRRRLLSELLGAGMEKEVDFLVAQLQTKVSQELSEKEWGEARGLGLDQKTLQTEFDRVDGGISLAYEMDHGYRRPAWSSHLAVMEGTLVTQKTVNMSALAYFTSYCMVPSSKSAGNLDLFEPVPAQPDINRRRFTTIVEPSVESLDEISKVICVPYRETKAEGGQGDLCPVLPVDPKHTELWEEIVHDDLSARQICTEDIMESFEVIYGAKPVPKKQEVYPSELAIAFLKIFSESYDLADTKQHLVLIKILARKVWGGSTVQKLVQMKLPNDNLGHLCLFLLASKVPLRFGYVFGEWLPLDALHQILGCQGNTIYSYATIQTIEAIGHDENSPPLLSSCNLKTYSNMIYQIAGKRYETGSIRDFLLEHTISALSKERRYWARSSFGHKLKEAVHDALEVFQKAAGHNPHLSAIKADYKQWEDQGVVDSLVDTFSKTWCRFLKKDMINHSPKYILWIVNLFVQYLHDIHSAKALRKLIQSETGKLLFPGGDVLPNGQGRLQEFSQYHGRMCIVHECRRLCAQFIFTAWDEIFQKKAKQIMFQKDRVARKLTPQILKIVRDHGLHVDLPKEWEDTHPNVWKRLYPTETTQLEEFGNLHLLLSAVFETAVYGQFCKESCCLQYGQSFEADLTNTTFCDMDLSKLFIVMDANAEEKTNYTLQGVVSDLMVEMKRGSKKTSHRGGARPIRAMRSRSLWKQMEDALKGDGDDDDDGDSLGNENAPSGEEEPSQKKLDMPLGSESENDDEKNDEHSTEDNDDGNNYDDDDEEDDEDVTLNQLKEGKKKFQKMTLKELVDQYALDADMGTAGDKEVPAKYRPYLEGILKNLKVIGSQPETQDNQEETNQVLQRERAALEKARQENQELKEKLEAIQKNREEKDQALEKQKEAEIRKAEEANRALEHERAELEKARRENKELKEKLEALQKTRGAGGGALDKEEEEKAKQVLQSQRAALVKAGQENQELKKQLKEMEKTRGAGDGALDQEQEAEKRKLEDKLRDLQHERAELLRDNKKKEMVQEMWRQKLNKVMIILANDGKYGPVIQRIKRSKTEGVKLGPLSEDEQQLMYVFGLDLPPKKGSSVDKASPQNESPGEASERTKRNHDSPQLASGFPKKPKIVGSEAEKENAVNSRPLRRGQVGA